jgi:hypothetical protein
VFAENYWHNLVTVNPYELEAEQLVEKFIYIVKTNSPLVDQENYELFLSNDVDKNDPKIIAAKKKYVEWMTLNHRTTMIQQIKLYLENKKV